MIMTQQIRIDMLVERAIKDRSLINLDKIVEDNMNEEKIALVDIYDCKAK